MSVTLKKDSWKIKDPETGVYRDSAVFSSTLPAEANQIVADASASITAQQTRANGIVSDMTSSIDSEEGRADDITSEARRKINEIAEAVASTSGLGVDSTLSLPGIPADAKATGDKLDALFPYFIDDKNYFNQMYSFFMSKGVNAMVDVTSICDQWYTFARKGWKGGVTFQNPVTNSISTGVKTGDNAEMSCIPSTFEQKNRDDYELVPLFAIKDCNVYLDEDGEPHITAIQGICGNFERNNPEKIVGVIQATGWIKYTEKADGSYSYEYTDVIGEVGYYPLPEAVRLKDNTIRSWVVHNKYGFGPGYTCCSGQAPLVYTVSHNGQITGIRNTWSNRYCGATSADISFIKLMLYIKYGRLDSDSVLAGCLSYSLDYACAAAETGVERILVTIPQGENLVVGSTISYGGTARAATQKVDRKRIVGKETVNVDGTDYVALNIDNGGVKFDTTTADHVLTMPWYSGSTDGCLGNDGGQMPSSMKYPVRIQGIEVLVGNTVILGDTILNYETVDDVSVQRAAVCRDASKISSSITANYIKASFGMPNAGVTTNEWKQIAKLGHDPNLPEFMGPCAIGGSSSTLTRDGYYIEKEGSTGLREWRAFGYLNGGSYGGFSYVLGSNSLSSAYWAFGGWLSLTGNRGEWVAA